MTLDPIHLPYYALRTLIRMFAALAASLVFTLVVATLAARSRRAGQIIVPMLDILQSMPILGFLTFTVTFFMGLFPGRILGVECAVVFAIFTSQAWFVFRPVVAWADRFRFEQTASTQRPRSWAYDLFRRTRLLPVLFAPMRQRVGLARAIVVNPSLLLMDEPVSALDVLTAETLRSDLLDLWAEGRMPIKSILIVTHNVEEAVLMCDRILVFSSNPGRVAAEIRVALPQPRDRLDPAFRALVDAIYARMTARAPVEPVRAGLVPGSGIQMVLPRVSTNALAGLIEKVDASPFDGRAAMADLAEQLEIDDLFPMAETLQLLRFAGLHGANIVLTPAARRYAQADVDTRKAMFAQALLSRVPLAQHIRRIFDELEDHMSEDYADETLRTVTLWERYAEIFAYDEDADRFSLEDAV